MKLVDKGDVLTVVDVKELGANNSDAFRDEVKAALPNGFKTVEIDLSQTNFIDSCGLGALIAIQKFATSHSGSVAVRLTRGLTGQTLERFHFYEFTNVNRWVRRWPQLWSILAGDFCWVGNRPISASKAGRLHNDFERLWLHAPVGLVSLADVRGWVDSFSDEARAHSSFYAVQRNWRMDLQILGRAPIVVALSAQKLWENQLVPTPVRQWLREEYPTNYRF